MIFFSTQLYRRQTGFSLMELFYVLAIVAVMVTASVLYFGSFFHGQTIAETMKEVKIIVEVAETQLKLHGNYANVNAQVIQKTGLIPEKYNYLIPLKGGCPDSEHCEKATLYLLAVPWSDQISEVAGIFLSSGEPPYDNYTITFINTPAWACETLLNNMRLISKPDPAINCDLSAQTVRRMTFTLPKINVLGGF